MGREFLFVFYLGSFLDSVRYVNVKEISKVMSSLAVYLFHSCLIPAFYGAVVKCTHVNLRVCAAGAGRVSRRPHGLWRAREAGRGHRGPLGYAGLTGGHGRHGPGLQGTVVVLLVMVCTYVPYPAVKFESFIC